MDADADAGCGWISNSAWAEKKILKGEHGPCCMDHGRFEDLNRNELF